MEEKGSGSLFLIPGCSKRSSSKAAGNGATEAYPRGYVARRHTTESAAGGLFQQPSRFDGHIHKRRYAVRPFLIRYPQLEPVGSGLGDLRGLERRFRAVHVQE